MAGRGNEAAFGAYEKDSKRVEEKTATVAPSTAAKEVRQEPEAKKSSARGVAMDDRSWMDNRRLLGRTGITEEFVRGVKQFIEFAKNYPQFMNEGKIRCPCIRCKNRKFEKDEIVELHLLKGGFVDGYKRWIAHGEHNTVQRNVDRKALEMDPIIVSEPELRIVEEAVLSERVEDMVRVAACREHGSSKNPKKKPNVGEKKFIRFIDVMESPKESLFLGSEVIVLEVVAELLNIKLECSISDTAFNFIMSAVKRMLPKGSKVVRNLYENYCETKQVLEWIKLSHEKIDACENDCMLFYKEDESKTVCSVCGLSRYKQNQMGNAQQKKNIPRKQLHYMPLIPRLQRLYMSKSCAKDMRWHKESPCEDGMLVHPSDGEAWKHFDATYPEFADEVRNVRLGICYDGFNVYGSGAKSYLCSSVFVTVYNLPPWLCMDDPYMILTLFISGRNSPGKNIDVYLRPLLDELKQLWVGGTRTWDGFKKENFNMRAAVLWTVNDFPAYGTLSGWSTQGKFACPYCMDKTKAFTLSHSKKPCWFDCHRQFLPVDHSFRNDKNSFTNNREEHDEPPLRPTGDDIFEAVSSLPDTRWGKKFEKDKIEGFGSRHRWTKKSIFWELPYWKTNLIRHNLDVMDIEKHVFNDIFNTLMDFTGTTKDTGKSRMDLKEICMRPSLELSEVDGKIVKPVARYVLTKENKQRVMDWLKYLRLPDGYAFNIGNCVNLEEGKIHGLKSHDCHVLLERLIPIALRGLLPDDIWVAITELSEFFRALTSSTLRFKDVEKLEKSIVVTLCKLEKIFPPSVFNLMEHLSIHLAYEARLGGPIQYRSMYPFKRVLRGLKRKMNVKVEMSILEAVITAEIISFVAIYFQSDLETRLTTIRRDDASRDSEPNGRLSVFTRTGRFLGLPRKRTLSSCEYEEVKLYVLLNCLEVQDYLNMFKDLAGKDLSPEELAMRTIKEFPSWLKKYVSDHPDETANIRPVASEPHIEVNLYNGYFVGGYVFYTKDYDGSRSTWNRGVNRKGNNTYYGILKEVIELRYPCGNSVVLFNCDWIHPEFIRKHDAFDFVDVHVMSGYADDDVFILASQAQPVYMTPYPCPRADFDKWWAVWKTMARSVVDITYDSINTTTVTTTTVSFKGCYQEDEMPLLAKVSSDEHLLDDVAMVQNGGQFEEVLPAELPPPPLHPGQLGMIEVGYHSEDEEPEEGEDDSEMGLEDKDQDELEFEQDF